MKYSKEIVAVVDATVERWERLAKNPQEEMYESDCRLCCLLDCECCPVFIEFGWKCLEPGSPYKKHVCRALKHKRKQHRAEIYGYALDLQRKVHEANEEEVEGKL